MKIILNYIVIAFAKALENRLLENLAYNLMRTINSHAFRVKFSYNTLRKAVPHMSLLGTDSEL